MEREEIVQTLENEIKLYKHLGLSAVQIDSKKAHFKVSLRENFNHKGTAFGGSLYAAAVLSAYSLVLAILKEKKFSTQNIVIARGEIRYLKPVDKDFDVICESTPALIGEFADELRREGSVRQDLVVKVQVGKEVCAQLRGRFVVKV